MIGCQTYSSCTYSFVQSISLAKNKKKSLQPRFWWGWSTVRSCDITWYHVISHDITWYHVISHDIDFGWTSTRPAVFVRRHLTLCRHTNRSRYRMISHDWTAHEYLGCDDYDLARVDLSIFCARVCRVLQKHSCQPHDHDWMYSTSAMRMMHHTCMCLSHADDGGHLTMAEQSKGLHSSMWREEWLLACAAIRSLEPVNTILHPIMDGLSGTDYLSGCHQRLRFFNGTWISVSKVSRVWQGS